MFRHISAAGWNDNVEKWSEKQLETSIEGFHQDILARSPDCHTHKNMRDFCHTQRVFSICQMFFAVSMVTFCLVLLYIVEGCPLLVEVTVVLCSLYVLMVDFTVIHGTSFTHLSWLMPYKSSMLASSSWTMASAVGWNQEDLKKKK